MQSFWDLLPASLWPTQPFISPDEQARTLQALRALQASANAFSGTNGAVNKLAGSPAWPVPNPGPLANGGDDASMAGGILSAILGPGVAARNATSFEGLIPPPQQERAFAPMASTANQFAPRSAPTAAPGLTHAQRPIDTKQPGWAIGAQPYFPPQNFVHRMMSDTPEPVPLSDDVTRKPLQDYAVSRGIVPPFYATAGSAANSTAGEITKEPPVGAQIAPWSAAHGLLDLPVIAPIAGLTEAAIRSTPDTTLTDEEVRKRQEWTRRYYIPRPGEQSPPNPAAAKARNPLDLVMGPLNAFHEAWDPPLHPPPDSVPDDAGHIYVKDGNGEGHSRLWSDVDPAAARAYYDQEWRRANFAPSFAVSLLGGGSNFAERGAVGAAGSRLGTGARRHPKRVIETPAPGALPDEMVAPLAQAGAPTSPVLARPALTGQDHHAISKPVWTALDQVPGLSGIYGYRDPRFVTRAIDKDAHNGWQKWHRSLDNEVATHVNDNPLMTPDEFERYLRKRYAQPDLLARFPNGL
jgi:hypothetical protein